MACSIHRKVGSGLSEGGLIATVAVIGGVVLEAGPFVVLGSLVQRHKPQTAPPKAGLNFPVAAGAGMP